MGQVVKVLKNKFYDQGYDKNFVASLRNPAGDSISDLVSAEILRTGTRSTTLATSFWQRIFAEFKLQERMFVTLPEAGPGSIPAELEESLVPAHSENPATRTIEPFLQYLEVAPKLDATALLRMVRACGDGPIVNRKQSHAMLLAVLKYIGKHELHLSIPYVWLHIAAGMDSHMTKHFWSSPLEGVHFADGHMVALSALIDKVALRSVISALVTGTHINPDDLRVVLSTRVGTAMFEDQALEFQYDQFVLLKASLLDALMETTFDQQTVEMTTSIMHEEVRKLVAIGFRMYKPRQLNFNFLQQPVTCDVPSLHDEWSFGLMALAKTLAVLQNKLPRLPWEVVCFGQGAIPGVSSVVKAPEAMLKSNLATRNMTIKMFAGMHLGDLTFSRMKSEVSKMRCDLCQVDASFIQEIEFLVNVAEPFVETKVHKDVLACFPSADKFCTIAETMKNIEKIKQSAMLHASNTTLLRDVEGCLAFISDLHMRYVPASSRFCSIQTAFFAEVLARCELFLHTFDKRAVPDENLSVTVQVHGKKALEIIFKDFVDHDGSGHAETGRLLLAFGWLLTDDQLEKVYSKMKDIILVAEVLGSTRAMVLDDTHADGSARAWLRVVRTGVM